jgi:lysozyme
MRALIAIPIVLLGSIAVAAQPAQRPIPLTTQDVPRSVLAEIGAMLEEPGEAQTKGVGIPFIFPQDAAQTSPSEPKYLYGVDLSHHNFGRDVNYDLPNIGQRGVSFIYLKASQGERFFDRTFKTNWKSIKILKGGYHFLTADGDPVAQANNFIQMLSSAGYKPRSDLLPVLDIEWDCTAVVNSKCLHDKWSDLPADEIIKKASAASERIKSTTGVTPVFYSNYHWLQSVKIANSDFVKKSKWWLNDFTKKAREDGKPTSPNGVTPLVWQFTENGKLIPSCNPTSLKSVCADTNRVSLSIEDFKAAMTR